MKSFFQKLSVRTDFFVLTNFCMILSVLILLCHCGNLWQENPLHAAEAVASNEEEELNLDALDSEIPEDGLESESGEVSPEKKPEQKVKSTPESKVKPKTEQAVKSNDSEENEDLNLDVLDLELSENDVEVSSEKTAEEAEPESEAEAEAKPEAEPEAEAEPEPEAEPEAEVESSVEAIPETNPIIEEAPNTEVSEESAVKDQTESVEETSEKNDKKSRIKVPPLETVLPANSALIIHAVSVRDFNERLEKLTETNFLMLLKTLGKGSYAKQVAPDSPLGAILFPEGNTFQWAAFVPMKNYKKFLALLNVNTESFGEKISDGTISAISNTLCITPFHGYAVLGPNERVLKKVMAAPKFSASCSFTPSSVKDPTLSIELTNVLIRFLVRRGKIGMEEFAPIFTPEMLKIQENSDQMALVKQYFDRVNCSISWLDENIQSARLDLAVRESSTVLSSTFLPKQGTLLEEKIQDSYVPLISTRLDQRSFLKVVPTWPAPLCGQVDIPPLTAEKLQAPFNRIRHVEFSLMTPPPNGRLAEAWCFFLEVCDSNAFIQELLIPKAEEVGEEFGANTLGEIGRDLAQQSAERRLARQLNRQRPPLRYADPQEAAERGGRLGGLIGGLIGKAIARKEAMKVQDYMGYDLYVSDLVQYTQLKKRIREQNEGTAQPVQLSGGQPGGFIGFLVQQVMTGEASMNLQARILGEMKEDPEDPPLVATRNLIVVLDANHLLIVPGNDFVLHDAIRRWKHIREEYNLPIPEKTEAEMENRELMPKYDPQLKIVPPRSPDEPNAVWHKNWETICDAISEPNQQQVRFAAIFVPKEAMKSAEMASRTYNVEIPERIREAIPAELPPFLTVYTTSRQTGSTFTTIPHEMSKAQFQKLITNLPALLAK